MRRRDFLYLTGMGTAGTMIAGIPVNGRPIHPEEALKTVDVALKKRMADVALNAARTKGATYSDVRIIPPMKIRDFTFTSLSDAV